MSDTPLSLQHSDAVVIIQLQLGQRGLSLPFARIYRHYR